MKEFLEEGEDGYIAGEDTPNPDYIDSLGARLRLRMQCMTKLQGLLPIHNAEQRIEAAEQKFIQLLTVIQEKAPFLLPGVILALVVFDRFIKRLGFPFPRVCRIDGTPSSAIHHIPASLQGLETVTKNEIRLKPTVRTPKAAIQSSRFDSALAEIRDDHWERLSSRKNKVAIDLDAWREPN